MVLTNDQRTAIDSMLGFIESNEMLFVLKGYAGTGKTTCLASLIEEATPGTKFFATATTHKAAKVLKDKLPISCSTIHSLLRLKLTDDTEQQHLVFAGDNERDAAMKGAIVIVDEASMMTKELLEHAIVWCTKHGAKMIFVGDIAQLPPIEKGELVKPGAVSPVWSLDCEQAELNEIMRYDGGIAVLGEQIRLAIDREDNFFTVQSDNDGKKGVFKVDNFLFEDSIRRAASKGMFKSDTEIVVTAYTNARVQQLNDMVRASMWGAECASQYVPGERIVLTAPYKIDTAFGTKLQLRNRQELLVLSASESKFRYTVDNADTGDLQYKCWNLECETETGDNITISTIHVDDMPRFKEVSEMIAQAAKNATTTWERKRLWSQFWKHGGCMAKVSYAYCFTTHTTQGSTYQNVIVDVQNIMSLYKIDIRTRLRSLYVAVTRAAKVLVVN